MSKIQFQWITAKRLLERWNLDLRELHIIIQNGLPVYNPKYELENQGPIYNKIPNPEYDPNDFLPQEYILEKNNLHDFQVLLESPFPIANTGLTKNQILSNLLFKKEDVEIYEKEYGLNKDFEREEKEKPSDFEIFDSIVNGELRPFLDIYSSEESIRELIKKKSNVKMVWTGSELCGATFEDQVKISQLGGVGENIYIELDETDTQPKGILTLESDEKLEELWDLDIPPPPDLKAEYFLSLIEEEYEKIELTAKEVLSAATDKDNISFYAHKNIQTLKLIAGQADILSKKLESSKGKRVLENSNDYIISMLKLFLIRSIQYFQQLFQPFLRIPLQDEYELRTELYGEPPIDVSINDFKRRVMEKFFERLGNEIDILDGNKSTHSIQYFKNLAMNKNWRKLSANQAVSVGFVGLCHLKLIMATDEDYLRDSQNLPLNDIYFSVIKEEGPPLFGPQTLHPKNFKDRLNMWMEIIGNWTLGNYPYFHSKRSTRSYLELYNYDCASKKLATKPIKDKLLSKKENKQSPKKTKRANQAVHIHPAFIKLGDLRNFLTNEIGIPLPPLLFPIQQDYEFTDGQIKKLRPNQMAKIKCREIAQKIWMEHPKITIADMLTESEIVHASKKPNRDLYSEKTVRNWIKDLCPNRSPGRPKKIE